MRRVVDHPILGSTDKADIVHIFVDEKIVEAREGEPVAAALIAAGIHVFRRTAKGSPRSLFCGIGQCTDCAMVVDGVPNVRTCVTPVVPGMKIKTQAGAGPGGIDIFDSGEAQ